MSVFKNLTAFFVLFSVICSWQSLRAQTPGVAGVCYGSTSVIGGALFITINTATGAGTLVGPTGLSGGVPALAINSSGDLYASGSGVTLSRIDASTGNAVFVAVTGITFRAITFDANDVLYGVSNFGILFTIDPGTGAVTPIGPAANDLAGLAFDPTDGTLWASRGNFSDGIYTIDPLTGFTTLVGVTGLGSVPDIHFDDAGNLYGATGGAGSPSNLISIDKSTGTGTVIGPIGFAVSGMTSILASSPPATVNLTSPNGGETWQAGTNRQITWTSNGVSGNIRLEYSAGAPAEGEPWILIDASTPNDGSYLWSVPNAPTSAALVRVSSVSDPGIQDVSDGAFTITGSALAVTRPNGAESFSIGAKENVNWNPGGLSGTVRLEYSTDNGANWSVIQASVANDGNFKWTVPATASAQSLVRVTSNLVPSITDVCDAVFTIGASAFALTNPTGGENWTVGSAQYIQWNPDGLGGTVALWYSTDGGAGWTSIDAATLNDGSFKWFIPNQVTAQAQVRIETNLTPSNADTSGDFTISAPGLLLIRPDGGESFVVGTKESIFWNTGGLSGTVRLEYSTDGGGSFSIIKASVANDGNFRWLVPNDVTAQARVRVRSNSAPSIADTSDNDFAISLTLPKGGQIGELIPEAFGIYQNFPNPFNPSTQIRYDLPEASEVTLKVYNMLGKEVSTLAQGMKPAGIHFSTFDATGLSSGIYIYRIQAKGLSQKLYTQILKMAYVK